ncbi:hypothetical protein [Silvibacterium dinghuense]|uniref:Uncharacterized protein n=1 Tax=Silvibacterium dinghuense TaxID=1560006 RepID=A0A4Q1SHQ0_9BACT|nr:hypothetical protein [Silvibacterium dinghuense]RXS96919.1 hypothetical protein ESZ00_02980 [Silvibacterium dinghuense]GGG94691.1 hypothetical protein GCM10011586_07020 [Silvibacterium dinghuense]
MIDNDCSGSGLAKAQDAAVELYQLAALLLGRQADAVALVEEAFAGVEIDPCAQQEVAAGLVRERLLESVMARMAAEDPKGFVAPAPNDHAQGSCIEDDDLSAAGLTPAQLSEMIGGSGREEMRAWLEQLPAAQRAIFIQRAVLGRDNATTAASVTGSGGGSWTAQQVSDTYRQALCSLANSLVHAAVKVSA